MIYADLIIMFICAALNWWGGYSWHNARRFLMPFICALMALYSTHSWEVGVSMLISIAPLCIGYGEKSILEHIFNDAWARFVWMVLVSTAFVVGALTLGHVVWWMALVYIFLNASLGIILRKIPQVIGDPIFGFAISSVLLLLHR